VAARLACVVLFCAGCASTAAPQPPVDFSSPIFDFALPVVDLASTDLPTSDLPSSDMMSGACPSGTIPSSVNTLYAGDTAGGKNLATDTRTNWGADPDHALLFVAPKAGTFQVSLTSTNQLGTDCGVVLRQFGTNNNGPLLDETSCAAMGSVATIDGVYAATPSGMTTNIDLGNAQDVLMWVSCAQTAVTKTMVYDLKVVFQ
jgi:hypothetical protein